ncbi:MAG: hypothetical protein AB7P37_11925 [Ramlibacter sp.]
MTTSIALARAQDLFTDNEVVDFKQAKALPQIGVAGASWVASGASLHETLSLVLKFVLSLVKDRLPSTEIWLLVGTRAWQPGARVVRHYKLWDALQQRGIKIPNGSQLTEEVVVESKSGIKFFGAAKLLEFAAGDVAQVLLAEHCTYLIAVPADFSIHAVLRVVWSGDLQIDSELIGLVAEADGLLLKKLGEFDDPERGVVAIGRPRVVNALFS